MNLPILPLSLLARRLSFLAIAMSLGFAMPNSLRAQDEGIDLNEAERMFSFNRVELKDQLTFGLRVAFPEQQSFIDNVVARVDNGELPRAMVNVVFVWARKRNPKIPYPYFEIAMRVFADRRGVNLPASGSF